MKERIYLDTDVILDFLTGREKFFEPAAEVFRRIEEGEIEGYVSSLILWNLYYWLERHSDSRDARAKLKRLRLLLEVISVDGKIIDQALDSGMKDFEDAVQYYAALSEGIEIFLTRNKKDYRKTKLHILDCEEYIKLKK